MTAQQDAALVQPPFHRGNRERQKIGNVGDGPILDVVQPQHRLVIRGQRGQGIEDTLVLRAPRKLVGGRRRLGSQRERQLLELALLAAGHGDAISLQRLVDELQLGLDQRLMLAHGRPPAAW